MEIPSFLEAYNMKYIFNKISMNIILICNIKNEKTVIKNQ